MSKRAKPAAKPQPEGLNVKGKTDDQLVAAVRQGVADLCLMIAEADKRGIDVNFNIGKPPSKLRGGFQVTQCDIRRRL